MLSGMDREVAEHGDTEARSMFLAKDVISQSILGPSWLHVLFQNAISACHWHKANSPTAVMHDLGYNA